jgi:hypothetical protein
MFSKLVVKGFDNSAEGGLLVQTLEICVCFARPLVGEFGDGGAVLEFLLRLLPG